MSASFVVHTPTKKTEVEVNHGHPLQDYILKYDAKMHEEADDKTDHLFCGVATEVFLNNLESPLSLDDMLNIVQDGDIIHIVHRPQGFDPFTLAIVAAVAAVAVIALIPTPEIPQINGLDAGQRKESPNNSLSGQTNIARPYEAIPEIYGRIRAYPDLIAPSVFEYIGNRKVVRETFCIGVGEYDVQEIRDTETLISEIPSASATVYNPGTFPNDLMIARESNEIDGQELAAQNEPGRKFTGRVMFSDRTQGASIGSVVFDSAGTLLTSGEIPFRYGLAVGEEITISGTSANNRDFTITGITNSSGSALISVSEPVVTETSDANLALVIPKNQRIYFNSTTIIQDLGIDEVLAFAIFNTTNNDGNYTVTSTGTESIQPTIGEAAFTASYAEVDQIITYEDNATADVVRPGDTPDAFVGWFNLPGTLEQIWFHIQAPRGLRLDNGGSLTLSYEIQVQRIDSDDNPVGSILTFNESISGATLDAQFRTHKYTSDDGIVEGERYRFRLRRTSNFVDAAASLLSVEEVFAVTMYDGSGFGNVTLLDVITRATEFAVGSSQRRINAQVTRKLGTARTLVYNPELNPTQSFADAVTHILLNAGRDLEEIDIEELYEIEQSISSELAEFNFSFDDEDMTLGERIRTACNCARVSSYRDGQIFRFVRDEPKPSRTLAFNRRNIASGSQQQQAYRLRKPNDFDGVALRYTDPETNRRAEVLITIDADSQQFIEGQLPARPQRINLAGCRNENQARDRAHLEARRLLLQRRQVVETVLNDGNLVDLGDRVSWVDIFDGDTFDGEILAVDGNEYEISERFDPVDGVDYLVLVTDSNGNVSDPVPVTRGATAYSFNAELVFSPIVANNVTIQAGSKYLIGNADDTSDTDFTVVSKRPEQDGRVRVEMVNYTDDLYEMDGA